MKIPTTPPGGAPYYHGPPINGMELNPSWQANGVMVDGAPSNNNNGPYMMQQQAHHHNVPPQPPHHAMPNAGGGYMSQQAGSGGGSYYPPSEPEDPTTPPHNQDFSEYMWMENQEEFDKQVMQQLEEEALMEQCIEAMLADEREAMGRTSDVSLEEQVSKSTLNPLAAEFVPSFLPVASIFTGGDESSSVAAYAVTNVEVPTEALKDLSLSKTETPPLSPESAQTKDDKIVNNNEDQHSPPTSESSIVVVSAKDVLTPKSSIDDTDKTSKSRERKDSDKKKGDSKKKASSDKKEKGVVVAVTAAVVASKTPAKTSVQRTRTLSGGDKSKANNTSGANKKVSDTVATISKKQEVKVDDTVDLQGPPLPAINVPIVSALSSAPVSEPEKPVPSAPAVFNYAAAARANLPPKQTTQPQTQPPKETTPTPNTRVAPAPVSNTTAVTKPQAANPPNKIDATSKPKSAKSGEKGNTTDSKKATTKGSSGTKKGKK